MINCNDPNGLKGIIKTSGIVPAGSDYTICGWFHIPIPPNFQVTTPQTFLYLGDNPETLYQNALFVGQNGDGAFVAELFQSGIMVADYTYAFNDDFFYGYHHFAYVRQVNIHRFYIDGVRDITGFGDPLAEFTFNMSGFNLTHQLLCTDAFGYGPLKAAWFREYDYALTLNQVIAEANSPVPVNLNPWSNTPLETNLLDTIAGRNWAFQGESSSFETNPTPLPSTNIDRATAHVATKGITYLQLNHTEISNFSNTFNFIDPWFKYIPLTGEVGVGGFSWSNLRTFWADVFVYRNNEVNPYLGENFNFKNINSLDPYQFGVASGNNYYVFNRRIVDYTPAFIQFSLVDLPHQTLSGENILITPDQLTTAEAFLGTFVSTSSKQIVRYLHPFPHGECADSLGPRILTENRGLSNDIKLYNTKFELLNTIIPPALSSSNMTELLPMYPIRSNPFINKFFLGNYTSTGSGTTFARYDSEGVLEQTWTIAIERQLFALATSPDGSILYYTVRDVGAGGSNIEWNKIRRYDLVNNLPMSDLFAGYGSSPFALTDILVRSNGNIVAIYTNNNLPTGVVRIPHIAPDGTLLNTLEYNTNVAVNGGSTNLAGFWRINFPINNYDNIWVLCHLRSNPSGNQLFDRFDKVRLSDMAVIDSFPFPSFDCSHGSFDSLNLNPEPLRYGIGVSCPLLLFQASGAPTNPLSGIYVIEEDKRNDTYYTSLTPITTTVRKIPDPTYRLPFIGK